MVLTVHIDGACEPVSPNGIASYGFIVSRDDKEIYSEGRIVGEGQGMSNNYAEYSALCAALTYLLKENLLDEEIVVRSDSQLLVNQMSNLWAVHGGLYLKKYAEARTLVERFRKIIYQWIPREQNEATDALSRKAYEEYLEDRDRYEQEMMEAETEAEMMEEEEESEKMEREREEREEYESGYWEEAD